MQKPTAIALSLIMAFSLCSCGFLKKEKDPDGSEPVESAPAQNMEYPVAVAGAELDSRPGKAVSLSPAITEKLVELGLSGRLEGISDYDNDDGSRVRCGTAQEPDFDAIEKLDPHILLTAVELDDEDRERIRQMGIQIAVIPRAATVGELKQGYMSISKLFEGKTTGAALGDAFNKKLQARLDEVTANALTEPKNAVYIARLDYEVATGDTMENELMDLIGLNNIAKEQTGWLFPEKEANEPEGRAKFESIDFIFCDKNAVTIKDMEQSAFFKGLNAVRKDYYLYIDETAFECQSMRMFDELEQMLLYAAGEIPGSKDAIEAAEDISETA